MLNEIENLNSLSNDDLFKLVFEILDVSDIKSQKEADVLVNYLTDCPSPIREAVAYKLEDIILEFPEYFNSELSKKKLINAISDINPNVSRVMCNILEKSKCVSGMLVDKILDKISTIITEIKEYEKNNKDFFQNKIKNKKNHAKNKLLFSLYWYMEALYFCDIENHKDKILNFLNYTIDFCDYTIREKTAKLLTKFDNPPAEILQKAKYDQNFYVKIQVHDKIYFEDLN